MRTLRSARRRAAAPVTALAPVMAATLLLSACATGSAATEGDPPDATTASGEAVGYPVTLDNCGTEVTFEAPPQRILTVKSTTTELMLSLAMGDRMVGTAFSDGPLPERLAQEGADGAALCGAVPAQAVVLGLEPDRGGAGWESVFAADGAGERDSFVDFGVHTCVAPSACQGEGYKPDSLTF